MNDPVLEAAQALTPLLAAGADGVAGEATRQVGESAAAATRRVIDAIRSSLGGAAPNEENVAGALRDEMEKGTFTQADLFRTVKVLGAGGDNLGVQVKGDLNVKGNVHSGHSIQITGGDFHG